MKNNKKAFSLAIAMGLVLVTSLLAYAILEYIIPFAKNIRGIENSTTAFYKASQGIEEGLYFVSNRDDLRSESGATIDGIYSYSFNTFSSGSTLPLPGKGTSQIDRDWNRIAAGEPIQLSIGDGVISDFDSFELLVKVPDLGTELTLSGAELGIINWQLSSETDSINPYLSGSVENNLIKADDINNDEVVLSDILNNQGIDLYKNHEDEQKINEFYDSNCGDGNNCTLKFSVINKLESTDGQLIPYLEWQIKLNTTDSIALRYTTIESKGVSYGFQKDLEIRVPQTTVSEAFDFTVFQ